MNPGHRGRVATTSSRDSQDRSPAPCDKAGVKWLIKYAADDRYLLLGDARELVDLLDGIGRLVSACGN